jgi:hypothetical protein
MIKYRVKTMFKEDGFDYRRFEYRGALYLYVRYNHETVIALKVRANENGK